jgi:hypothetical protein
MRFLLLTLLISCGKEQDGFKRCYSREEALNYCVAARIAEIGESTYLARIYCAPKYQADACYNLGHL